MIERSLAIISNKTRRGSLALRNDLRNSFRVERRLEKNSLALKSKLVEERDRTLKALALRSTQKEKDKKGGVGGALGLLGGGALGRRFFGRPPSGGLKIPRVPKVPTRGGAFLSRVGKVGRLGKIGPLAVIGTGIDFAGRKAEGQTNLQAGLGAGGGLAGALAGAKYGAILGTAVGGPIGTVVGGIGGSIIGGLAGGRLADIFSGADRRRKFEEQRVIISTQKTLFSSALDDLDRVLDKLEKTSPFLVLRRDDDDELPERTPFRGILPKPVTPFYKRPEVLIPTLSIAFVAALLLGGPTGEEIPIGAGLLAAMQKTKLGAFIIKKVPFLTKLAKKADIVDDFLVPGKDIPGISPKGIRVRIGDDLFRKLFPNIKFKPKGTPRNVKPKFKKIETNVTDKDIQNLIKKNRETISEDSPLFKILKGRSDFIKNIKKKGNTKVNPGNNRTPDNPSGSVNLDKTNLGGGAFSGGGEGGGTNMSFDTDGGTGSDTIALAPINNIFLMNQENSTSSTPQTQGGTTILIGGGTMDSFDTEINIRQMEILQTA